MSQTAELPERTRPVVQRPLNAVGKSSPYKGVTLFRPTMKWRAQISAFGKTTSLGDHDTEELAAVAFDRACIHKHGREARTNFPLSNYESEIEGLQAMDHVELIATLRSKARKSGQQSSHFRGVSLLKQTKKWHAQINVGGKQVHLGFFPTEEFAARAYDRAAINKGAQPGERGKIITNFDILDYKDELELLRRISQSDLFDALSHEGKRRPRGGASNAGSRARAVVGQNKKPHSSKAVSGAEKASLEAIYAKAERAQPKSTARNPLYQGFAKKEESGQDGRADSTRPPGDSTASANPQRLGRLFAGVSLPSLEGGAPLTLPFIDQTTGAPAAATPAIATPAVATPTTQATTLPSANPVTKTPAPPKPAARVAPSASSKRAKPRNPKRSLFTTETQSPLRSSIAVSAPMTPDANRPAAALPSVPDLEALYGASTFARYAKFLAPSTMPTRLPGPEPVEAPLAASPATKEPLKSAATLLSPKKAAAPHLPPTPPRKRQRAIAKPAAGPSHSSARVTEAERSVPFNEQRSREEAVGKGLLERLRLQQAEHKRQQAEQRALVSEVIDHVMARPLTKRQEAIATKKQEEAAATLAGARQHSPLPDEVGDALMDFAEAAELAELEDQAEEIQGVAGKGSGRAGRLHAERPGKRVARKNASKAESSQTRSTVTQSDLRMEDGDEEEQSSALMRYNLARGFRA